MPLYEPEAGETWSERASLSPLGAVIDPKDSSDRKNVFIDAVQRQALQTAIPPGLPGVALDFGCGNGRMSQWLVDQGHAVVGLEAAPEMLRAAAARVPGAMFVQYDGASLPVRGPLGAALSIGVLQYFPADALERMLTDLAACLAPGGRLVIIEQEHEGELGRGHDRTTYERVIAATGLHLHHATPIRRGWSRLYRVASLADGRLMTPVATFERWRARTTRRELTGDRYVDLMLVAERPRLSEAA